MSPVEGALETSTATVPKIRLLIADDDDSVREALADLLGVQEGIEIVALAIDADQAIRLAGVHRPDVALLDVRMPGGGGVAAMRGIANCSPETRALAFTALGDRETVAAMVGAGARGFLVKSSTPDELLAGIREAAAGRTALSPEVAGHVVMELAGRLSQERADSTRRVESERLIRSALQGDVLHIVFQPIMDLATRAIAGYEALARFNATPPRPPNLWFADAELLGLRGELEVKAIQAALEAAAGLQGAYVAVNLSPGTLLSAQLMDELLQTRSHDVVVEITEHAPVDDYSEIRRVIDGLRGSGVRLAVDDVGAGFASLRHIVKLEPDLIKADISLVTGVETDPKLRAVIASLVTLAGGIGAKLVAEGIETPSQMAALIDIGVGLGQGYLLGRPGPLPLRS